MLPHEVIHKVIAPLLTLTATSLLFSNLMMTYVSWAAHHYNTGKKQKAAHALLVPGIFAGRVLAKITKRIK